MEEEVLKHPLYIDNRSPEDISSSVPEVVTRVVALGDSSVTVIAWAYAANAANGFVLYCDLLRSIKE